MNAKTVKRTPKLIMKCVKCELWISAKCFERGNVCDLCVIGERYAPRYSFQSTSINDTFYQEYLRHNADNNSKKILDKVFANDEENYVDVLYTDIRCNHKCSYSCLWLIDTPKGYVHVFTKNINGSSCMAMVMSVFEPEEQMLSLPEVLEMSVVSSHKTIKN